MTVDYKTPGDDALPADPSARNLAPQPLDTPRALTPVARWAILLEPRVRRWWLMLVLLLIMFTAFCIDRLWARHVESMLIRDGETVTAKIIYADNKNINQPFESTDPCKLMINWSTGPAEVDDVHLSNGGVTGHTITLHVDKQDHTRFTDRTEPTPLLDSLLVGLFALPILPVLLLVGYRENKLLQRTWINGQAAMAVVFERKQSPIAPMSFAVRCSMADLRTRDLFTVYVPHVGRRLQKGDVIWVITGTKKVRPLAALWMPPGEAIAGQPA